MTGHNCISPGTAHYLTAIRRRLEQLYDASASNPRLREQLSDEVDWVDAQIERSATPVAWRWRAPGAVNWIYDPEPAWREARKHEIELEPLYAASHDHGPAQCARNTPQIIFAAVAEGKHRAFFSTENDAKEWGKQNLAHCFFHVQSEAVLKELPLLVRRMNPDPAQDAGWQLIETAPKDKDILAVRAEWWMPVNGNHRWIFSEIKLTRWLPLLGCFASGCEKQPTHWMPAPPMPEMPIERKYTGPGHLEETGYSVPSTTWCGYCVNTGKVGRRYEPDWQLVEEPCPKCTVVTSKHQRGTDV